ncbi:MAG: tetratricopeptide repeat protein, partial [Chloroflexi bacterium]|nr:tetratricopeptide repeat protein [Chloroflexota bacterium]
MISEPTTETKPTFFTDARFERMVAILIAVVAVLAALAGYLQAGASARSAQANRDAQRFAIQAMGRNTSGQAQLGYDLYDAFHAWSQLNTLAQSAGEDSTTRHRYEAVRDRITGLSPLLAPPYFDPTGQTWPDVSGYEADVYLVEATALTERFTASAQVGNAWSNKANSYVAHLTLLAVTLFLYGLSTTISGRVRWLFVIAGMAITGVTLLWLLLVVIWPVPVLADEALVAYARGVGLAYRGKFDEATAAFDQALVAAPDYANAFYERGNAHFDRGDYQAAAADYEAAQAAGRDDANVAGNLGWTYYLLGRFDDAIEMDRHALEMDADLVGAHFNLGLALLAAGQIEAGQAEYANV